MQALTYGSSYSEPLSNLIICPFSLQMFFISEEDRSGIPQKRLNMLASNTDECGMEGRRAGSDHLGGREAAGLRKL